MKKEKKTVFLKYSILKTVRDIEKNV